MADQFLRQGLLHQGLVHALRKAASENAENAREKVASLGIALTRDQPHSLRNGVSARILSIRSRVVGMSRSPWQ